MTREETITELKILKEDYWDDDGYGHETKQYDDTMLALDMAIEALEQEPRTGHWIEHDWKEFLEKGYYRCSICNHGYQRYIKGIRKSDVPYIDGQEYILRNCDNYCPNCGAKMVEP